MQVSLHLTKHHLQRYSCQGSALWNIKALKEVVVKGKKLADELQEQSVLVDENTAKISKTVELLVENVWQFWETPGWNLSMTVKKL